MAYWDSKNQTIIYIKPIKIGKGWYKLDCGCCNGLRWGGEEPIECSECGGGGFFYLHRKSGVIAQYPGGPLMGRWNKESVEKELEVLKVKKNGNI
jgi:hypothetical protein